MEFTVTVNTSTKVTKSRLPIQLEWKLYLLKIMERYPVAVDTSDTVELGFLIAVTINLSFFRNMMQYSVVLSAALKDDTCPASHIKYPGSIVGEYI